MEEMKKDLLWNKIKESDMILAGIGEEFDLVKRLKKRPQYVKGCGILKESGLYWAAPAWNMFCADKMRRKSPVEEEHFMKKERFMEEGQGASMEAMEADSAVPAVKNLAKLLEGRNYFVVSTSVNDKIFSESFSENNRFVTPCGGSLKKQCGAGCEDVLQDASEEDSAKLRRGFEILYGEEREFRKEGEFRGECSNFFDLGKCPKCGAPLVLNNIYAEHYNENGYLERWNTYKKWLQGTLNHRLLILELGVGMQYPSVIRWPFEKAAFFHQKAFFIRVNETLYQLTEELSGKGCGISMNAIDWLCRL